MRMYQVMSTLTTMAAMHSEVVVMKNMTVWPSFWRREVRIQQTRYKAAG